MKHLTLLSIAAAMMTLVACKSEDDMPMPITVRSTYPSYRITPQEAADMAAKLIRSMQGQQTRSYAPLRVKSIEPFSGGKILTRSNSTLADDTLLYLINFEDEGGFAIMGANRSVLPVYAISDEGSFNPEDADRDGIDIIINGIVNDATNRLGFPYDSVPQPDWNEIYFPPITAGSMKSILTPKLSAFQSRIHYNPPFCKYCTNSAGELALTGCAPEAVEAAMSYYRWPKSYKGYTFDWSAMQQSDTTGVARMLQLLGLPENLNVTYYNKYKIATAFISTIPRTFRNLGYNLTEDFKDFFANEKLARKALAKGPIIMSAQSTKVIDDVRLNGHTWVIDGYLGYYTDRFYHNETTLDKVLYHCVWGWGGHCNGFFYVADKKAFISGPDEYYSKDDQDNATADFLHYDIDIKFLHGYTPNR